MFDLPPIKAFWLRQIKDEIESLKRGNANQKPHKFVMLLAVVEMFENNLLPENKIYFGESLVSFFEKWFNLIRQDGDWCQPVLPFFHLRGTSFWHHKIIAGREFHYAALKTSGAGTKRIRENIEYVYLSDELFDLLQIPLTRNEIKQHILGLLDSNSTNDEE